MRRPYEALRVRTRGQRPYPRNLSAKSTVAGIGDLAEKISRDVHTGDAF